jgi:hypothetical protein
MHRVYMHFMLRDGWCCQFMEDDVPVCVSLLRFGPPKINGMAVGKAVAAQWIALRANDGLEAPVVYTPGHGQGICEPVPTIPAPPPNTPPPPAAPWLAQFRPFALPISCPSRSDSQRFSPPSWFREAVLGSACSACCFSLSS